MKLSGRRSSAVLEAPEQRYVSGTGGPRRVTGGLRRDQQDGFGGEFEDAGAEDADSGFAGEDLPVRRRMAGRMGSRPGFLGRITSGLPQTLWGRIAAGTALVVGIGLCIAGTMAVRSALLHDERFVIPSSAAIQIEGNQHVTKAQLLSIFGEDVERNIFTVSLAERRTQLEQLPWVEHATVMRLLPDHLRVSIVERTPVAFVRQGGHIGLVDKSGVLMDMVSGEGDGAAHYSFPVVTGISGSEPLSTRSERMKIFERFTTELDAGGSKISGGLSEVDLSDPEDVKALIPDEHSEVLVHFGDTDFLSRYEKYKAHLGEWRTQYPKLASVDMRYDRQVVLEMQPGSAVPVGGQVAASAPAAVPAAGLKVAPIAPHVAAVHHPAPATVAKGKPVVVAKAAPAPPTPGVAAPVVGSAAGGASAATPHLTVAKDVPAANRPGAKKAVVKKPVGKKAPAKKIVAKRVAAKKTSAAVKP